MADEQQVAEGEARNEARQAARLSREAPQPDDPYAAERTTKQWYVIHTYSGYENKVKANLEHRIETMDARGATKLHPGEREQLVQAGDALLFGEPDSERLLHYALQMIRGLRESGRWPDESAGQLREHLRGCGALDAA